MTDKKTIITVDDEPILAETLAECLSASGFKTKAFIDPYQAIDYIKKGNHGVDAVVTDYHILPSLTGLQMMRQIHHFKKIPFILLSGALSGIDDEYCIGEICRFSKPFEDNSIIDAINTYFKSSHLKTGS